MKIKTLITLIATAVLWLTACTKDDNSPPVLTISPENGETNVTLNKNITLEFPSQVTRSTVQANFHMMNNQKMTMIRDSMLNNMSMMGMMMNHNDSITIYNGMMSMMNRYRMGGTFIWNADSTQCIFDPDSMMTPNSEYAMHMGREMMQMMNMTQGDGMMTDGNHGMMGNAGGMMQGDMVMSFSTGSSMGN